MMTFNDLHRDIDKDCDCTALSGVAENTNDFFARAIPQEILSTDDLKSYYERGRIPRYELKRCRDKCKWRGVSVNKLDGNKEEIKSRWIQMRLFSPQGLDHAFVCTFQLKSGAGKLWDTSNNEPDAHHDLLKADGFSLESVEVKEVVPFADF